MKIVHVVDYSMPQMGYQEFLLPKFNAMNGDDVYILTSDRYFPVPNYDETWLEFLGPRLCGSGNYVVNGVNIHRFKSACEIKGRPWIVGLIEHLNKLRPDVIFVHGTGSFSAYRVALANFKFSPIVFFDNHMIYDIVQTGILQSFYYWLHRNYLSKLIAKRAKFIYGVTEETCSYLSDIEGFPKEKIKHLPLSVDDEHFQPDQENRTQNKTQVIVQTGKFNFDKKPNWTSDACLKLLQRGEDIQLRLVGSGDVKLLNKIKKDFEAAGFADRLSIEPMVHYKNLPKIFQECDIAVYPDGTSLSALEAASAGCLVVMADLPASRFRERDGIGITYSRGDLEDLTKKLSFLLKQKDTDDLSTINIRCVIKERYSYHQIAKQLEADTYS